MGYCTNNSYYFYGCFLVDLEQEREETEDPEKDWINFNFKIEEFLVPKYHEQIKVITTWVGDSNIKCFLALPSFYVETADQNHVMVAFVREPNDKEKKLLQTAFRECRSHFAFQDTELKLGYILTGASWDTTGE